MEVNRAQFAAIGRTLNTLDTRLADMDRLGIDVQAISPSPGQYFYFTDAETGREAGARGQRRHGRGRRAASRPAGRHGHGAAAGHRAWPSRRCAAACSELDLRGIEISTNVNGTDFHAEALRPFWAAAEELGVLIFIHPLGFTEGKRLSEYYFNNLIGNPLESTLAIGHLIFGGVLDAHPGLKICVAHGGGYIPGYWGRMDHGWRARADCSEHCRHEPSSYLRKLWLDTLVFDQDQLDSLVRTHGADKLCLGTDYPFDMSEPDPSPADLRRRELVARVKTPIRGCRKIAFISRKGGVGKTSTCLLAGHTFATLPRRSRDRARRQPRCRHARPPRPPRDDRRRSHRCSPTRTRSSATPTSAAYTSQAPTRLEVVAADDDPRITRGDRQGRVPARRSGCSSGTTTSSAWTPVPASSSRRREASSTRPTRSSS